MDTTESPDATSAPLTVPVRPRASTREPVAW